MIGCDFDYDCGYQSKIEICPVEDCVKGFAHGLQICAAAYEIASATSMTIQCTKSSSTQIPSLIDQQARELEVPVLAF